MLNKSLFSLMIFLSFLSFKSFAETAKEAQDQLKSSTWEGELFSVLAGAGRVPVSRLRLHFSYHILGGTGGSYYELYSTDTQERGWLRKAFEKYILENKKPLPDKDIEITTGKLKLSWDIVEKNNVLFVDIRFYDSLYLNPLKGNLVLQLSIPFEDFKKAMIPEEQQGLNYLNDGGVRNLDWKDKKVLRDGKFYDIDGFVIYFRNK